MVLFRITSIILFISLLLVGVSAQECDCDTLPIRECVAFPDPLFSLNKFRYDTESYEGINKPLQIRNTNQDFHYSMQSVQSPTTVSMFSNWRKVTFGEQKRPFILDGELQPPISISLSEIGTNLGYSTLQIIPRFRFRIFRNDLTTHNGLGDVSRPVRTPSAMPGIAWFWSPKGWWSTSDSEKVIDNKYLGIKAYHHSNGQDGFEYNTSTGEVNRYNGNFGELIVFEYIFGTRFRGEVVRTSNAPSPSRVSKREIGNELNVKYGHSKHIYTQFSYEHHWKRFDFTNQLFLENNFYWRNRIKFDLTWIRLKHFRKYVSNGTLWCAFSNEEHTESFRLHLFAYYITDKEHNRGNFISPTSISFLDFKRLNIGARFFYVIPGLKSAALFSELIYEGADEYNIYFNESYYQFRIGIALASFERPQSKYNIQNKI